MNRVKIYIIIDPRNGLPFYIGATRVSLEKRLSGHISTNPKTKYLGNSMKKYNRLRAIKAAGLAPIIKLLKECPLTKADHYELFYYRKYSKKGYKLLQHDKQFHYASVTFKSRQPGFREQCSRNHKWRKELRNK